MSQKKQMSFREIKRVNSNPTIRAPQRLVFPSKERQIGYLGKKHFWVQSQDNVVLESPQAQIYQKMDRLAISDIEGTKPKLIQKVENVEKYKIKIEREKQRQSSGKQKIKTEGGDSLDILVKESSKKLKTSEGEKSDCQKSQIQKYLLKRNLELTKQNILGILPGLDNLNNKSNKKPLITPTYLSNLTNN